MSDALRVFGLLGLGSDRVATQIGNIGAAALGAAGRRTKGRELFDTEVIHYFARPHIVDGKTVLCV